MSTEAASALIERLCDKVETDEEAASWEDRSSVEKENQMGSGYSVRLWGIQLGLPCGAGGTIDDGNEGLAAAASEFFFAAERAPSDFAPYKKNTLW